MGGGEGKSRKHRSSPSSGTQGFLSHPLSRLSPSVRFAADRFVDCFSSLVQGRKRGGSGRGGTRRRAGGAGETTGTMTTAGTRRGRRGNTATGTKAKVGLLIPRSLQLPVL